MTSAGVTAAHRSTRRPHVTTPRLRPQMSPSSSSPAEYRSTPLDSEREHRANIAHGHIDHGAAHTCGGELRTLIGQRNRVAYPQVSTSRAATISPGWQWASWPTLKGPLLGGAPGGLDPTSPNRIGLIIYLVLMFTSTLHCNLQCQWASKN